MSILYNVVITNKFVTFHVLKKFLRLFPIRIINYIKTMNAVGGLGGIAAQQNPQQQQQQQSVHALDNISKIKSLIAPLRESLSNTIKTAAQTLNQNCQVDVGSLKGVDDQIPRFDKSLEEFYSICDQVELHLKTSIKCLSQSESSNKYLHLPVAPTRNENLGMPDNTLTYPQYLSTVNAQISFTKEIHDTLIAAAQNISPSD